MTSSAADGAATNHERLERPPGFEPGSSALVCRCLPSWLWPLQTLQSLITHGHVVCQCPRDAETVADHRSHGRQRAGGGTRTRRKQILGLSRLPDCATPAKPSSSATNSQRRCLIRRGCGSRTRLYGFADRCLTAWLNHDTTHALRACEELIALLQLDSNQ